MLGNIGFGFGGSSSSSGAATSRRRGNSVSSKKSSHSRHSSDSDSVVEDDTTVVEPDQGNVLMHIMSQLRPGADLSRVTLPTFILEPRSMLERITNFMCHPEMLLPIPHIDDPTERFLSVVKFYLSGWHIKPPGVKKPLNPILGEIFTCYWDLPDNTRAYYISEQTSHHPPKSSYFFMAPEHHVRVDGTLKPRSRFLGNSAASMMEGTAILTLMNRGKDPAHGERYYLTQPNMYARGILFGKMKYELGDHSFVRCPELGLVADIEFKTKGYWSGVYDAIGGTVKNEETGEVLYELSGLWTHEMFVKNVTTGQKEMFFNAHKSKPSQPLVRPIQDQEERESQRLWHATNQAIKERNHEIATAEKTKIEDTQREEAAKRAAEGLEWHPRLFRRVKGGPGGLDEGEEDLEWILNVAIDGSTPQRKSDQILAVYPILKGQKPDPRMEIPPRSSLGSRSNSMKRRSSQRSTRTIEGALNNDAQGPAKSDPTPYENTDLLEESNHADLSHTQHQRGKGHLVDCSQRDESQSTMTYEKQRKRCTEERDQKKEQLGREVIQGLLNNTGTKKEEGPLINLSEGLSKELPAVSGKRKS